MTNRSVESAVAEFLSGALAVGDALRALQENVTIAVLRRPTLGSVVKGTGLSERHFPPELRVAFKIAITKTKSAGLLWSRILASGRSMENGLSNGLKLRHEPWRDRSWTVSRRR